MFVTTLKNLRQIDIFLHDSDHSYQNMKFEFEEAWPFIKDEGILLSDNIDGNKAFPEFSNKVKGKTFNYGTFGAIIKHSV